MRSAILLAFTIFLTMPQTSGAAGTYAFPRPADLDRVYTVLDFRSYATAGMTEPEIEPYKKAAAEAEEARLKDLFMRLQAGTPRSSLTPADQRIYDLFRNDPDPYKFQRAADDRRLRWQHGIRERFGSGYRLARRYFPEMERIFTESGLGNSSYDTASHIDKPLLSIF